MITTIEARYVLGGGAYWSPSGKDKFKDKKKKECYGNGKKTNVFN